MGVTKNLVTPRHGEPLITGTRIIPVCLDPVFTSTHGHMSHVMDVDVIA